MVSTTNTASAGTNPLRCFAVIGLIVMESKANEYSMSTTHATEAELFGREHTETRRQQEKLPCLTQGDKLTPGIDSGENVGVRCRFQTWLVLLTVV